MAEPITEKEKIENPNAGGMSTRALVVVFVLYALSRSIKPSSSYLPHYFPYADALSSEVPNYTKLGPLYHTKIQPVATVSQFLFYIAVVLFSSQIGFDVIIWLDIFCQIANVLITCLIRIPTCRNLMVAQLGTFVYGISTATGNVFHNFAYCVFEKDMYHKISGYTRSATLFGHLLGSSLGGVIYEYGFDKISKFTGLIENKVSGASDIAKLDYSAVFKESNMKVKEFLMNGIVLLLFLTAGCMLFTFIVAFFFPKLSKEAKKASKKSVSKTLKDIAKASSEFKKKEVLFWAIAWSFSLMAMLYSKQWCPNLWKHYQDFYKEKPRNGIFDAVAYVCGAVGALVPGMINKRIGFGASITLQLFVTAIAVVLAFLQTIHLGNIYFYYGIHALFTFIIYYSMAFQSGELARSTSSDKIKLLFYMMNAGTFFIQVVLNQFLDGFGRVPSIDITSRYYIMTGFMLFNFMVVFIGFSGAHRHSPTKVLEESGTSATPVSTSSNKEEK